MRTRSIAVFLVAVAAGLFWLQHRSEVQSNQLVLDAKAAARAWSASKQSDETATPALPVVMPSLECRQLNQRIVASMSRLHEEGRSPPFSPSPLLEILRTGDCADDNPSVQVLLGWIAATHQSEPTPRNNEP